MLCLICKGVVLEAGREFFCWRMPCPAEALWNCAILPFFWRTACLGLDALGTVASRASFGAQPAYSWKPPGLWHCPHPLAHAPVLAHTGAPAASPAPSGACPLSVRKQPELGHSRHPLAHPPFVQEGQNNRWIFVGFTRKQGWNYRLGRVIMAHIKEVVKSQILSEPRYRRIQAFTRIYGVYPAPPLEKAYTGVFQPHFRSRIIYINRPLA